MRDTHIALLDTMPYQIPYLHLVMSVLSLCGFIILSSLLVVFLSHPFDHGNPFPTFRIFILNAPISKTLSSTIHY